MGKATPKHNELTHTHTHTHCSLLYLWNLSAVTDLALSTSPLIASGAKFRERVSERASKREREYAVRWKGRKLETGREKARDR